MRILIMAGGTGGHVFPALAVAKQLIKQGHVVHWLGTSNGLEVTVAKNHNIPIHKIAISGLRGKRWVSLLLAPWRLTVAFLQSLLVIWTFNPNVVLGMGGYVTGPAGLVAWILGKRLVIHEQNAVAGLTNQILARFSYLVLEAFPKSFPNFNKTKITGNPVREDFYKLLPPARRIRKNNNKFKILVLGGSAGARAINNIVPKALAKLDSSEIMVWHQTGEKNLDATLAAYNEAGINTNENIKVAPFIQDMANAYSWADIVICRSGALTVSEIAISGVASILIPYPYAVDDHQTKNAEHLVKANAAILIQERDLSVEKLAGYLEDFIAHKEKLLEMAKAAYKLANPKALHKVVEYCVS